MLLCKRDWSSSFSHCGTCCQSFALTLRPLKAKRVMLGSGRNASTYVCCFFKRKSNGSDAVGNICTWGWVERARCAAAGVRAWQAEALLSIGVYFCLHWNMAWEGVGGLLPASVSLPFSFLFPPHYSPPTPTPLPHALKSHFQARRRINLWALHIAGSWKQDVGSFFFFFSFSLSASWLTFLPLEEFGRPWDSPPPPSTVEFFSTLITLLRLHPNRLHMLMQLTSVSNYFTCDLVYFLRKSARYLLRTNKINLSMSF